MEDQQIVELLYVHDETGLIATKNKYESMLNAISLRIVLNQEDSCECVNDTYLKIWNTIPPYKPGFYKSFICKIVRQISIDKYRFKHRQYRNTEKSISLSELDYDVVSKDNVDEKVNADNLEKAINKFIENLDIQSQVLFIRKYFLFENSRSLSKRYSLSETNINVKLFRIRNKLKKYLESEGFLIEKV